jgi:hypothetical protein
MNTIDQIKVEISAFCELHEMQPTTFSKHVTGDGHLVADIYAGKDIRASTIDRIRNFMRTYKATPPKRRQLEAA